MAAASFSRAFPEPTGCLGMAFLKSRDGKKKKSPDLIPCFLLSLQLVKTGLCILPKKCPTPTTNLQIVYSNCSAFGKGKDVNNTLKCSEMQQYCLGMLFSHLIPFFFGSIMAKQFDNTHCSLKNQTNLPSKPPGQCRCVPTSCVGPCISVRLK